MDNEKCLEIPGCCEVINLVGSQYSVFNLLYFQSERVVSNRPLFIDSLNEYAVWFDGEDWMIGSVSDVDEGKLTTGEMHSIDENVVCPIDGQKWIEYYSESWRINPDVYLKCDGKCIR